MEGYKESTGEKRKDYDKPPTPPSQHLFPSIPLSPIKKPARGTFSLAVNQPLSEAFGEVHFLGYTVSHPCLSTGTKRFNHKQTIVLSWTSAR